MPIRHITPGGTECGTYRYAPPEYDEKWQCDGCGRLLGADRIPFL